MSDLPAWAYIEARKTYFESNMHDVDYRIEAIARALVAERERCAKIAENYGWVSPAFDHISEKVGGRIHGRSEGEKFAKEAIAAAIRNQEPER